jgi:PIN domain nuclease of toxin-antitoxin system
MKIGFDDIKNFMVNNNINILPIEFPHIQELIKLPKIHNGPFDRIIIAQGILEKLRIVTKDEKFTGYPVDISGNIILSLSHKLQILL